LQKIHSADFTVYLDPCHLFGEVDPCFLDGRFTCKLNKSANIKRGLSKRLYSFSLLQIESCAKRS
jgi:hypothetical protein